MQAPTFPGLDTVEEDVFGYAKEYFPFFVQKINYFPFKQFNQSLAKRTHFN